MHFEINLQRKNETQRVCWTRAGGNTAEKKIREARTPEVCWKSLLHHPYRGGMPYLSLSPGATRGYGPSNPPGFPVKPSGFSYALKSAYQHLKPYVASSA